jgi:phosphatidate cytidylyltransferase
LALNFQTLKTRALTALIFVLVMLGGLLWNMWGFVVLLTIIHFGCWYEFVKLMKKIHAGRYLLYSLLGVVYITIPVLLMLDLGLQFSIIDPHFGTVHFARPWAKLVYDPLLPCAIIFSIWINDTMAYLVGSMIGKTPFSKVSPKKTLEGTIGGILLCVLVIAIAGYYMPVAKTIAVRHWAIVAAICAVFGTAGDLLESKIKRMAEVKDSGSFMPGHGGFLDRFDSLLVAIPFVWIYVKLFI